MSDEERAREIVEGFIDESVARPTWAEMRWIRPRILAALSAVRRETIERCAAVADEEADTGGCCEEFDAGWARSAEEVAKRIRALATNDEPTTNEEN